MDSNQGLSSLVSRKRTLKPIETKRTTAREGKGGGRARMDNGERTAEEEPLSPPARLFHTLNCCIIVIMGFKTEFNVNVIKVGLEHTLLKHPRFSSILTINDVLLGVTQAGLSRYLNRSYSGEDEKDDGATEKKNNLPKSIRLRAAVIFNIRPSAGIEALADMMEKESKVKWGNWLGYIFLPFNIALRDDPLDYIRQAKSTIDRKKHSLEAIFSFSSTNFILKSFGDKAAAALCCKVLSNTTILFSNMVGPLEEISFYGHPVAYIAPTSYGLPHALTIHFQSYVNNMTIVLAVDQCVIPDPHQLCDDLEESLKLIKNAVVERGFTKNATES